MIKRAGKGCFLAKTDIKNPNPSTGSLGNEMARSVLLRPLFPYRSCELVLPLNGLLNKNLNIDYIIHLLVDFLLIAPSYDPCTKQIAFLHIYVLDPGTGSRDEIKGGEPCGY